MKKIHEYDFWYHYLRYVVNFFHRNAYKKLQYIGREKIPQDQALIYAPNHCNALMDALAVLEIDRRRKVFVARADIFQNPIVKKCLTFLKIMPINRVRDGFRSVLSSEDTIEKSIEVLNNRVPFCILPEGTHRAMHSLLPLGKGISRIACGAVRALNDGRHVLIVPVGLEYGDYFRLRTTLLVTVGQPVDITAYMAANPEMSEGELLSNIRYMTAEALKELIVYIPDDDDYEATWELAKCCSGTVPECKLQERLHANRAAVEQIQRLRQQAPETARKLFEKALAWKQARQEARVSLHVTHARKPLVATLWRTLLMLLTLPLGLAWTLVSAPVWAVGEWLARKTDDLAFRNSLRSGVIVVVWSILLLVAAIVLFCTVPWYWALAALVLLIPAPTMAYEWFEQVRRLFSAWRWQFNGKLRRQRQELMAMIHKTLENK
jgi:1-acyl-sn-glycerol-3-phosphate acyltransferase